MGGPHGGRGFRPEMVCRNVDCIPQRLFPGRSGVHHPDPATGSRSHGGLAGRARPWARSRVISAEGQFLIVIFSPKWLTHHIQPGHQPWYTIWVLASGSQ